MRLTPSPVARKSRVVAVGEARSTRGRDHLAREAARLRAQLWRPLA